jgi:hypothetical protein
MKRISFKTHSLTTISWLTDSVVDWANSMKRFYLDGKTSEGNRVFGFTFDSAVTSPDGIYAVIFQKLGTKGLLLKNGNLLREINRSYYQADSYDYPVAFITAKNGRTYLIHCPKEYCRIDFEDVETGEIITDIPERKPQDFFHSRFEVSSDNLFFLDKGWGWHPVDIVMLFDIETCLKDPLLLDKFFHPEIDADDVCAASFINDSEILIGAHCDPENQEPGIMAIWNHKTDSVSETVKAEFKLGTHLTVIDDHRAWDLYEYPKIINYKTGQTLDKIEDINTGKQMSSITGEYDKVPMISFDHSAKKVAIGYPDKLEILIAD